FMEVDSSVLQKIVDRCLVKEKNDRLQTAAELATLLREAQTFYHQQNMHTMIGIKTIDLSPVPENFHLAPAPTAVGTQRRSSPVAPTAPPPVATVPVTMNPTAQAPPPSVPPTELLPQAASPYDSPEPAYASPAVATPVAAKSASKILLIIPILLLVLAGGG